MKRKEIFKIISLLTKIVIMIFLVFSIVIQLGRNIIVPININVENNKKAEIKSDLKMLVPDISDSFANEISDSIEKASEITNINDKILISVAYHESKMKPHVVSSAGYKGIMQATKDDKYEFALVDIIRGAKKLENWIKYRKGNLNYALASYNGGTNPPQQSFKYANNVIKLAKKLQKKGEQ